MTAARNCLHFHRPIVPLACFCMLRRCPHPTALATWDQLRLRGSTNFAMQDKAGGRRCRWARRVTVILLINHCHPLRQRPSHQSRLADRGWLVTPRVTSRRPHSLHPLSITTRLFRSNISYSRKLGPILLERDPRSYELPLNSSATSRRTGWKITHSFGRSKSGTMALTISSGQRSWSSVYRKL